VIGGDTIAGESSTGTLRYLLIRPVGRNRLLVAKLVTVIVFIFLAVIVVALVALLAGVVLFGIRPLSSISATELSPFETFIRTVAAILYIGWSMLGLGAIALFASTRTDSPLAASLATLAAFVGSQVLDLIEATNVIQPYLPTHYWLKFVDFYRDPILWRDVNEGIVLQAIYVVVFLGAAWANFTTKDITS
jgi:ABC-2 type transport system permease protein